MTIFNRKKHSCCSTFLDVLGIAELSQGGESPNRLSVGSFLLLLI